MTTSAWIMIAAVLLGPIAAVVITLLHQGLKQRGEQKFTPLRYALAFSALPGDTNLSHAINMIPFDFANTSAVLKAHREFIEGACAKGGADKDQELNQTRGIKQLRLIYAMARTLGFKIRETDLQTESYTASGYAERDLLMLDAHRAWRAIANLLFIQAQQAVNFPLSDDELNFVGVSGKKEELDAKKD